MEIVPGLHWVERIRDTKVYLYTLGERVIIVDTAMPGRAGAVLRHLSSLGYGPQDVGEIWLTHSHLDHMGSAAALKQASGARVVAHSADAPVLEGRAPGEMGFLRRSGTGQRVAVWVLRRLFRYRPVKVDHLVSDGDWLGDWQVVHAPGHTAGSVCYYHPERKLILVGDAINHRRGRLGAPPSSVSADVALARASIARIARLDFEVCCFGHGPPLVENARQRVLALAGTIDN